MTAGALAGLGLLTKTTAISLLPILLFAILIPQTKRPTWAMTGAALAAFAVLAGPWIVRNQSLYGDPLAQKVFQKAFPGSAHKRTIEAQIAAENSALDIEGNERVQYWRDWVGWWTARSFFGVFGYMDIWLNESGNPYGALPPKANPPNAMYRVIIALSAILFISWLGAIFRDDFKEGRPIHVMNGLFLLLIVGLFVVFNMTYFQGQGRYLYPAIGPIALAFATGGATLLKGRGAIVMAAFAGLLLLLNVYAIARLPAEFQLRMGGMAQSTTTGMRPV
jgi:hypothetical protein